MFQYSSKSLFSGVREEFKILFLLLVFVAAFSITNLAVQAVLFVLLFALLFVAGYRDFLKLFAGLIPFLLLANASFVLFLADTGIDLVHFTLVANFRVLSLFAATAFFTFSTDIFALVRMMKKAHIPELVYLPIYILFRFLPEIEKDLVEISSIQRIKGITKRQPILYIESIFLPLLFTVLQKSDDLAIAYYLRKKRETESG